jgi:hypothetical protein
MPVSPTSTSAGIVYSRLLLETITDVIAAIQENKR